MCMYIYMCGWVWLCVLCTCMCDVYAYVLAMWNDITLYDNLHSCLQNGLETKFHTLLWYTKWGNYTWCSADHGEFSIPIHQTDNSRPLKYPVTGALVVPSPTPFMGVTRNWYITLVLVLLSTMKLNSGMLTKKVLNRVLSTVTSTRYQMSGSTPVISKLNGAFQTRWITWPRDWDLRLLTASSRPTENCKK